MYAPVNDLAGPGRNGAFDGPRQQGATTRLVGSVPVVMGMLAIVARRHRSLSSCVS
jgi:hypothetical protein